MLAKAQAAPVTSMRGKSRMSLSWLKHEQLGHIRKHPEVLA